MKMVVLRLGLACLFMTSAEAQNLAESTIIANYDDVIGTAPRGQTISAAGAAVEETQNGAQAYGFFTQTLANDIYYEVWKINSLYLFPLVLFHYLFYNF